MRHQEHAPRCAVAALRKPLVITGAMKPADALGNDGGCNMLAAFLVSTCVTMSACMIVCSRDFNFMLARLELEQFLSNTLKFHQLHAQAPNHRTQDAWGRGP